jgi:hypothetical protein
MNSLAQFLALGLDSTGAYSLSKDMTDLFAMSVNAVMDIISETFTKFAIPRLLRLNGLDDEGISYLPTPAGDTDITEIGEFIAKVGGYITWMPEDQLVLREMLGLPEVDVDTIAEAQENQRALQDARAQAMAEAARQSGTSSDDMSAILSGDLDYFEFTGAERNRKEKELYNRVNDFWKGQKKRVTKAAQDAKNQMT